MSATKIGYRTINQSDGRVAVGPSGLFGFVALDGDTTVEVFDNATGSGMKVYEGTLQKGVLVHFGGNGFAMKKGITFSLSSPVQVEVLFTGTVPGPGIAPINLGGFSAGFDLGFSGGTAP